MKYEMEPEVKPKPNIHLRVTVDHKIGSDFKLLCEATGYSPEHVMKQAVKGIIKVYRAEIDEQRKKKAGETDEAAVAISPKPKRPGKKSGKGHANGGIQVDTDTSSLGGVVLGVPSGK